MTFDDRVTMAFGWRELPSSSINNIPSLSDDLDVFWFEKKDWKSISWENWERYSGALYAFTPEAFLYYLPSIICLSLKHPKKWFFPADVIFNILDCSPTPVYWSEFMVARFGVLKPKEYNILIEWILWSAENSQIAYPSADFGKIFDTVYIMQNCE